MIKSLRLQKDKRIEGNLIQDERNLFRLKKEINGNIIKDIRNPFRLNKENKAIIDKINRDVRNLFKLEEGDQYKPVRAGNFWSNNYFEYESNGERNKNYQFKNIIIKVDHT